MDKDVFCGDGIEEQSPPKSTGLWRRLFCSTIGFTICVPLGHSWVGMSILRMFIISFLVV